jgi:outer membrane protein assembly factor BamB
VLDQQGGLRWSFPANGAIAGSPIIGARGTVIFGTAKGWLYAVKGAPGAGERSWPMHRRSVQRTAVINRQ